MYQQMKVLFIFLSICKLSASYLLVLKIKKQSGIKVFDLWNMTNLHCGDSTADLYRHDYIDRIDINCISSWYNMFLTESGTFLKIKYTDSSRHKMSSNLQQVLQEIPDFSSFSTYQQSDQYLTNQDNYEYLNKRPSTSKLFAGIYFNPADPGNSPQFVYNKDQGSSYTENTDPLTFSNIETADSFQVYLVIYNIDSCDKTSHVSNSGPCPGPTPPIVKTSMTNVITQSGATFNLDCSYHSVVVVTEVNWIFTDRNNAQKQINETTNPSKYSGSTYSTPSLTVKSFSQSDEGLYRCIVENYKGSGTSSVINASLAASVEPMCPCSCEYKDKLIYWAAQNQTNHTMEEWRVIIAPVIQKLEKELKVDTRNLSSSINKRISAKDSRPSSQTFGMFGIFLLSFIVGGVIFVDITSFKRHRDTLKKIGIRDNRGN